MFGIISCEDMNVKSLGHLHSNHFQFVVLVRTMEFKVWRSDLLISLPIRLLAFKQHNFVLNNGTVISSYEICANMHHYNEALVLSIAGLAWPGQS